VPDGTRTLVCISIASYSHLHISSGFACALLFNRLSRSYWGVLGDFDAGKPDLAPEELEKRKLQELQHGRLAMLAVLELLRHDSQNLVKPGFDGLDNLITGFPFLYN